MKKYLLGIDLGGTTIKFGLILPTGEIIHQWSIPTNTEQAGSNITTEMIASTQQVLQQKQIGLDEIIGAGMGCPGTVNRTEGSIRNAFNLGWTTPQLVRAQFQENLGIELVIENDANVAALGEKWQGSGEDAANLVFMTLGTGVGGGVIINNQIVKGVGGAGGEIGHFPVICSHEFSCTCGNSNCLETLASATGIVNLAKKYRKETETSLNHFEELSSAQVFQEAQAGDTVALQVVDEISAYLGTACSVMANLLNPSVIVIGGGVSSAKEFLLDKIAHHFEQGVFPTVKETTQLKLATLGNDAGILGAAYLVKEGENNV